MAFWVSRLRGTPFFFDMFTTKQLVAIVLIGLVLIILIQNSYPVPIKMLLFHVTMPLSILVLVVLLIGVLLGYWLNRKKSNGKKG
jgi:uncharacterized integral membrane protein